MKKFTLFFVSLWLITALGIAQTPQAFKYQAVARTSSGNLIQNQLVAFRISILQGGPSGTLLYQERHTTNTNNFGLANLDIGSGVVLFGTFSSIIWSLGQMYIKVELDSLGGTAYQNMGTMQLLSVPYALYSNTSAGMILPYSGSGSDNLSTVSVTNTGAGNGISGTALNSSGYGIYGTAPVTGIKGAATNEWNESYGVYGQSASHQGYGVFGKVTATGGTNYGVCGEALSDFGYGVMGTGGRGGVIGNCGNEDGAGVSGINSFETGTGIGVWGLSASVSGIGMRGLATSLSGINYGVFGTTQSPAGYGVFGSGPVTGIKGEGTNGSGESYGVYGESASTTGIGVYGKATASSGSPIGVYGESSAGAGIYGVNLNDGLYATGVYGMTYSSFGAGVYGIGNYVGVYGVAEIGVCGVGYGSNGFSGKFTNGKFYVDGNVGIGTEAPDCQLVIQAPDNQSRNMLVIRNGSGNERIQMRQNSNGSGGIWLYNGSDVNTIFLYGDGSSFILGNLGIGTSSPGYKLQVGVAGDGTQARANAWNLLSDARLKKDFTDLTDPLGMVEKINGYYYYWNTGIDKTRQVGFSAQEVLKVIPEVVSKGEDGYLSIDYGKMTPLLLEAIKELKVDNDQLKAENDKLKAENEKINARLDKIEAATGLSAAK